MAKTKNKNTVYNEVQVALLSIAFGKSTQTIKRWISNNDDRLTSDKAKATLANNKFLYS